MKRGILFLAAAAPLALATPVFANTAAPSDTPKTEADAKAEAPAQQNGKAPEKEVFSTGVAKGRDRLDSATSTSSLKDDQIELFGARSLAEILRNIPGVRAEAVSGEGNASYSIRGLPLASTGSKFLQFQEDGLPVLEFGDINFMSPDVFMRADLNLAQVEAIRGGSASTFASNSPGGVINLLSKTGDVEGGAIQATAGLDYGEYRLDFDYGSKLSDTLRFHIGGFYRSGEGPRDIGYDGYRGGQVKFNITKEFTGGYVRFYGKLLDDRTPGYQAVPVGVTGTNADPSFANIANFDIKRDSLLSPYITNVVALDGNNQVVRHDARDGTHPTVKSFGVETQFELGGWTITEKFRFADISAHLTQSIPLTLAPAAGLAFQFGGPGARLSYATGPNAGQAITNPASLNGNGLLAMGLLMDVQVDSLDNMTNDLRATRVWEIGGGKLTTTAGFYKSSQEFDANWSFTTILSDVVGGGNAALVNIATAGGVPVTQDGYTSFSTAGGSSYRRRYGVNFDVNAPYASVNYHIGKVAIGGSVRYDFGSVQGSVFGADLGGGRVGIRPVDINGDGVISFPESQTAVLPLTQPAPVDYNYDYLSYSSGINFRVSEPLAVFARYSRGSRAAADRILFTPSVSTLDGSLLDPEGAYDPVRQTEVGVKFRKAGLTLNLTGFLASTGERNMQVNSAPDGSVQVEQIARKYRAHGMEFEGGFQHGPFSLTAGATYTIAKISEDETHPELVDNVPRHQARLIFQATPQFSTELFTVGANVVGTTSSFAQDTNQLKMPGYATVNGFVQFRPAERVQLMLNANNLFDTLGFAEITQGAIPASGLVTARAINGRTISASVRFGF
jgi:outer membrane receptor protein involved in Fe transport